jgi:hypothetical protein
VPIRNSADLQLLFPRIGQADEQVVAGRSGYPWPYDRERVAVLECVVTAVGVVIRGVASARWSRRPCFRRWSVNTPGRTPLLTERDDLPLRMSMITAGQCDWSSSCIYTER